MEPKIITKPAFTVVGMKYHGNNQHNEIPQLWGKFGPRMHEVRHIVRPDVLYGVMDNFDEKTGEFDYMAAFEVTSMADVAEGMQAKTIPAQTYNEFAFLSVCGKGEENTNALTDITSTAKQRPFVSLLIKEEEVESEVSKHEYAAFVEQLPH